MKTAIELIPRGRRHTLKNAKWQKTIEPVLWIDGHILPIGTEYKSFETQDHGYMVLRSPVGGRQILQW